MTIMDLVTAQTTAQARGTILRQEEITHAIGTPPLPGRQLTEPVKVISGEEMFAPTPEPTTAVGEWWEAMGYIGLPPFLNPLGVPSAVIKYITKEDVSPGTAIVAGGTLPGAMQFQKEGMTIITPEGETVEHVGAGQLPLVPEMPEMPKFEWPKLPDFTEIGKYALIGLAAIAGIVLFSKFGGLKK